MVFGAIVGVGFSIFAGHEENVLDEASYQQLQKDMSVEEAQNYLKVIIWHNLIIEKRSI